MATFKDKKRGTWAFHGYYRDSANKRHQYCRRGFSTKHEAKEAEKIFLASAVKVQPSITLDELVANYRENYQLQGIKEATLFTNECYYKNHIKTDLGNVQLSSFTTPLITQWLSSVSKRKKEDGERYSSATINKCRDVLSKYLTYAVRLGLIEYNPCRSIQRFKRSDDLKKEPTEFWEIDTFNKFIENVDNDYWRSVFIFLFGTGLREGELFALQWADIDFKNAKCKISKTLTSKTYGKAWAVTSPKTSNSNRVIDLQDSLISLLKKRLEVEKKKDGFNPNYFVFGDIKPLARTTLARYLDFYIKKAGVPRITPHGFRHSHASYLIRSGEIDDQLIAERLGHTVEELRRTYAHVYQDSRRDLLSSLNKIF